MKVGGGTPLVALKNYFKQFKKVHYGLLWNCKYVTISVYLNMDFITNNKLTLANSLKKIPFKTSCYIGQIKSLKNVTMAFSHFWQFQY